MVQLDRDVHGGRWMSILIVEDNPVNAMILEANLQKFGYETQVVPTAKKALEYLASSVDVELILADIIMPEMDGLQLLSTIKERPEWEDIPVIMCSALSDLETVKKAIKAGCADFLIKPIEGRELLRKVQDALRQSKAVLYNKKDMVLRLGLNEKTYEEIAGAFYEMVSDRRMRLEKKLSGESEPDTGLDLSELRENAIYFGAERLRSAVEKLSSSESHFFAADEGDGETYTVLLRELRLVQNALEAHKPKAESPRKAKRSKKGSAEKPKKTSQKKKKKGGTQ